MLKEYDSSVATALTQANVNRKIRAVAPPKRGDLRANSFYIGNAVNILNRRCEADTVDLTVTSPPYDDLRNYNGFKFDAAEMLAAIYRVTKPGGVCVWVVGERINGGRSMSSFRPKFCSKGVENK